MNKMRAAAAPPAISAYYLKAVLSICQEKKNYSLAPYEDQKRTKILLQQTNRHKKS